MTAGPDPFAGADCRAVPRRFEARRPEESDGRLRLRARRAVRRCERCPVLAACQHSTDLLPAHERTGIIAGRVHP